MQKTHLKVSLLTETLNYSFTHFRIWHYQTSVFK